MDLQKNKDQVFAEVEKATSLAGRPQESVTILAVTKYVDADIAGKLVETGIKHIAENRVDKFLDKYQRLKDRNLTWHLIGSLQRRKVKDVINFVDYFHALDSVKLASEIQKRAEHPIKCFLQVNISGEESKHGFTAEEAFEAIEQIREFDKIELVGLMTMAPLHADDEELTTVFRKTNELRHQLQAKEYPNMPMTELSMGMSGDFKIAINEGATFVRIGSSFFID